jgi:predicted peptidase
VTVIVNVAPTANAGSDKTIHTPASSTTLAGSGSDPDGTISTYAWTKVSGGSATIASPSSATTAINGLVAGTYVFRLTVTDNRGGSDTDDVTVIVNAVPTANAGSDKTIHTPASSTSLAGSGSDSDGTISTYAWTKVSGGSATIASPSAASTNITGLVVGTYTFRLTVTDNRGGTDTDDVIVIVNSTPAANAGSDQTIVQPASTVTLNGSGSDSDGTITYAWTKVSGSGSTISSPIAASTGVTGLTPGVYVYRLTVTDNRGATKSDDVQVSVASAHVETLRAAGSTTAPYGFVEYLPEGYNLQNNWPIIIFLHGVGERLPDPLSNVALFGPNRYASPNQLNHKLPCVILSPQCPATRVVNGQTKSAYWQDTEQDTIEQFRVWAMANYKVNSKRFYLTGLSMGGYGSSKYLDTAGRGRLVAAAVTICPLKLSWNGSDEVVSNNVPVWAAHAMNDSTVGVSETIGSFVNISQRLGGSSSFSTPTFTNPPPSPSYATKTAHFDPAQDKFVYEDGQHPTSGVPQYFCTIYSSGGHVVWDRMFDDPQVYTWLFQFSRP